jgi:hypothetical protein
MCRSRISPHRLRPLPIRGEGEMRELVGDACDISRYSAAQSKYTEVSSAVTGVGDHRGVTSPLRIGFPRATSRLPVRIRSASLFRSSMTSHLCGWGELIEETVLLSHPYRIAPVIDAARTVKRYWDGILQWFDSKIANGLIVGINSPVQAAKAKARGYRSTRNLKAIIYLLAGSATRLRARPLASAMAGTMMGAADVTVEYVNRAVSKGATTGAKAAG